MEMLEKSREIDRLKLEKEFLHFKDKSRQKNISLGEMNSFEIDDLFKRRIKTNKYIKVVFLKTSRKQIILVKILRLRKVNCKFQLILGMKEKPLRKKL
jgi:hypothetical protein